MSVWELYKSEGRHLNMLMSTTRCLNMMKAWVVDTGLIPGEEELREGLKTDVWGILTPNRIKLDRKGIIVHDKDKDNKREDDPITEIESKESVVGSSSGLNLTPHDKLSEEISR